MASKMYCSSCGNNIRVMMKYKLTNNSEVFWNGER